MPVTETVHKFSTVFNTCRSPLRNYLNFICLVFAVAYIQGTMSACTLNKAVKGNADLTNKLYTEISKPNENVFFSPLSVHAILSLLYQGAEGNTEVGMRAALGIDDKKCTADEYGVIMDHINTGVTGVTLNMANKVYIKTSYTLKQSFKDVATKSFKSSAQNIDFVPAAPAAKIMNDWVAQQTNNKIQNLISPDSLDSLTRLVLINAIYFKGNWKNQFDKKLTKKLPFYAASGPIDTDMMYREDKYNYKDDAELDAKILEIPYVNENVSLVVVLPNQRNGIAALEAALKTRDLTTLTDGLFNQKVQVTLPKFKVETKMDLNTPLKKIGFSSMYAGANFNGLLDSPESLEVSQVIQKAFIEVNEEGAEAAAATGIIMMCRSMPMPSPKKEFIAEHPFMFFLNIKQDGVNNVMFMGKLAEAVAA